MHNNSVGKDNSNMCKDVVIAFELMQSQVENYLLKDVKLQNELRFALDILLNEHQMLKCLLNLKIILIKT